MADNIQGQAPPPHFLLNETLQRATIHNAYGGNRQAGISTPAGYPFIFIFSGATGQRHGYKDQWENDDVFSYTGEGQTGDMQLTKGNLALAEHLSTGKRVFLFEYVQRGYVQYKGELELIDYDYFTAPDRDGQQRAAIKFFFKSKGATLPYEPELAGQLVSDPPAAQQTTPPNETERRGLVTSRIGQGAYRKSVLHRWRFACAVTGYTKQEILIASHIVPWRNANNLERLDVHNGILLSPVYDALFDQHLIGFENNGKIILSAALRASAYDKIGVTGRETIKNLSVENHAYLERHRNEIS